eukprot:1162031-Pelagomonas_calceolata.AAC.7
MATLIVLDRYTFQLFPLEKIQHKSAKKKQTNWTYHFISDLMDIFYVAGTIEQAEQPNYLAEGQIPLTSGAEN